MTAPHADRDHSEQPVDRYAQGGRVTNSQHIDLDNSYVIHNGHTMPARDYLDRPTPSSGQDAGNPTQDRGTSLVSGARSGSVLLEDEDGAPYPEDVQVIARERDALRAEVEHWKHHAWEAGEGFKRAIEDAVRAGTRRRAAEARADRLAETVDYWQQKWKKRGGVIEGLKNDLAQARAESAEHLALLDGETAMRLIARDRAILDADPAPEAAE